MADLAATTIIEYQLGGSMTGPDGYTCEFLADDSFASWWSITKWNWHYRHWSAFRTNVRDLFTKIIRRKATTWLR